RRDASAPGAAFLPQLRRLPSRSLHPRAGGDPPRTSRRRTRDSRHVHSGDGQGARPMRDWKEEIAEGEAAELEGLAARLRAMQMDRYEAFGPTRSRSSLWRTRPRRELAFSIVIGSFH